MTNTRIASVLIAPFAIAMLSLACSSSDNNSGSGPSQVGGGAAGAAGSANTSGDAGSSGTSKGGSSSGGSSSGGSSSSGADCEEQCTTDNAEGVDAFNSFFVQQCGCAAGAACATECGATCSGGQVDQACGDCLNGLSGNEACINAVITDCQGDASCTAALTCLSGCGDSGGGGSSSGGGQACAQQCAQDNPDGVAAYQADAKNLTTCLCESDACKDKCAGSPICEDGTPQGSQECVACQDSCFATCKADDACSKLFDCVQACQLAAPLVK